MDEEFKRKYPNLVKELITNDGKVPVAGVRQNAKDAEKASHDKFRGYDPDVIDFLRRCDTEEEGHEIIEFLVKQRELSNENAARLSEQLGSSGIRSFGSKKIKGNFYK